MDSDRAGQLLPEAVRGRESPEGGLVFLGEVSVQVGPLYIF